jgi:transglutaminase-like putative cysteine protease
VTLAVEHDTRYHYSAPVDLAQHEAFLRPVEDEFQQLEGFEMGVDPEPSHHTSSFDRYGNHRTFFTVSGAHRRLEVWARSKVRVMPRHHGALAERTLPWERVRDRLRYAAGAAYEPAVEFCIASPYVPRLAVLHAFAAPSLAAGLPVALAAIDLMKRIYTEFKYKSASTDIDTPLTTVLEKRQGVCQDFAHLMIGALRMHGLAARYVSGYLLTTPPPDTSQSQKLGGASPSPSQSQGQTSGPPAFLGSDASHAWVSVWCPMAGGEAFWFELDPTNNILPSTDHVRLAYGRDYGDVTPLRGVIRGGGDHTLSVGVHTERVA